MWLKDRAAAEPDALTFSGWLESLQSLAEDLVVDDTSLDSHVIARLITVLENAPVDLAMPFGVHGNGATLLATIGPDTLESVMLRVIGDRVGFMISRGPQGLHYATIAIADPETEVSTEAASFPRACCKAVVLALLTLLESHPAA